MTNNKIKEKGQRTMKFVAYLITMIFILAALFPLVWMISSSMKDELSITAYPPKWLPVIPETIQITLDYTGQEGKNADFYEKDAMKAIWFPWKMNSRDLIGAVSIQGVKDGHLLYSARTAGYSFRFAAKFIVPSSLFNPTGMDNKLPEIRKQKLSSFKWYGDKGKPIEQATTSPDSEIVQHFQEFYQTTEFVKGKPQSMEISKSFWSIFDSYRAVILKGQAQSSSGSSYLHFFYNSAFVTLTSIALQLVLGSLAAYAISFTIRSKAIQMWLIMFFLATLAVPDIVLLVPLYLTMNQLHLVNSLWGIILPHTAWGIVIFLFKGFFDQLPRELMQAAEVDGASDVRKFIQIVLPMSIPIFTVVTVMVFLPVWNEFLWPLVIATGQNNWTITVALNSLQTTTPANIVMAIGVLSMVPLLIVFATCQKYIEKGASFTGVKG
ncbi:carbohydrate ABC transporter permease [Paenibacillus psychroresistens]|uniref:Carbohydrate ABC transporter permease n=1 Tax=Paenibacillus psychroresistens TaxID=1778678 RepID=A0A6B8RKR1_9BACL|nr:carbohydrate ABC transporter permease [Paenibacillus psychroresistens]QGQ95948.1 carbohydrate ABC transporter permease [Paenibacillus psychroresistens]